MTHLPRGIAPDLLLSQVKNTMPYLFSPEATDSWAKFPPSQIVREFEQTSSKALNHLDYFKLCVSAHYLTCATPVPTDVDNQIRKKLWPAELPLEVALQMAQFVVEVRNWDFTLVSQRFAFGSKGCQWEKEAVDGHLGEWFTIAAAAYCALKQYAAPPAQEKRQQLLDNIADEVHRHSEVFGSLWRGEDGLNSLKAAASIAHNFGDLDRVMDMWDLSIEDPLRLGFYKLAVSPFDPNRNLRYLGRLWVAGELYKASIEGSSMALENHRHFALRKPRCLRQNPAFLIPIGPFLDQWGREVALNSKRENGINSEDILEVVDALFHGLDRLPKTVGYGRALRGIFEVLPELERDFQKRSPATAKVSQNAFEQKWHKEALKWMDEIPSTAK